MWPHRLVLLLYLRPLRVFSALAVAALRRSSDRIPRIRLWRRCVMCGRRLWFFQRYKSNRLDRNIELRWHAHDERK